MFSSSPSSTFARRARRGLLATLTAATATVGLAVGAQSAPAATAIHTGPHSVCAESLTFHRSYDGATETLGNGQVLYITGFGYNGSRAYVLYERPDAGGEGIPGYVVNGYFC